MDIKKGENIDNTFIINASNTNNNYCFDSNDIFGFLKQKNFSSKNIYSKKLKNIKINNININNRYKINTKKLILSQPKDINQRVKDNKIIPRIIYNENKSPIYNIINYQDKFFLSNNKINFKNDNNLSTEKIQNVNKLWDTLFIPFNYRQFFNQIFYQLNETDKHYLIENEFNELNELKIDIDNLTKFIKQRIGILKELKSMNNNLKLDTKNQKKNSNSILIKNISNKIEQLRDATINLCYLMRQVKNKIHFGSQIGKFNIKILAKNFGFDLNYLLKMKDEMNFLKDGYMKYFFNIIDDNSPFLIKASENNIQYKDDPFFHIVPMTEEIGDKIQKCNFIIYQELIGYQFTEFNNNKFRPISPIKNFECFQNKACDSSKRKMTTKTINQNYPHFINRNINNSNIYDGQIKAKSCINIFPNK